MSLDFIIIISVFLTWLLLQPVAKIAKLFGLAIIGLVTLLFIAELTGANQGI